MVLSVKLRAIFVFYPVTFWFSTPSFYTLLYNRIEKGQKIYRISNIFL